MFNKPTTKLIQAWKGALITDTMKDYMGLLRLLTKYLATPIEKFRQQRVNKNELSNDSHAHH
ncbi:MAG: hypothetical protein COU66_01750 [Candidatus Pacebacteria bacterium CG10_big_fil_rev_8_21_14_0_10_44_11]|nr:MAG: hypothetical protein COU66_01750 [Candidatus Pacebacteria bacterium CG10_big_fil_rev_8_21_14_0_10_44_11]